MTIRHIKEIRAEELPAEIRCIALDLDGTLLNSGGTMSDYTRGILNQTIAAGIPVVVSSGRPFTAFPKEILACDGIEYAIASNGVSVHHLPTDRCLQRTVMDAESVVRVAELNTQIDFLIEAHIRGKSFADQVYYDHPEQFGVRPRGVIYIQSTRTPVAEMRAFILSHRKELDGIRIICRSDADVPAIVSLLQEDANLYITSELGKKVMELCHRDCGKHNGLSWLLHYLQIPRESCIAFGNAENDSDMLRFAGIGLAVSNSSPSCIEAADFLTDSNDEDGVARAIAQLLSL